MPPGRRHATPIMAIGKLTNELKTFTPILFHGRALKYFSADQGMMKRRPDSGKSLKIFIIIQPLIMRSQGTSLLSVIKTSFSFILFPPLFDLFAVLFKIFQQGSIFCILPDGDNHLPAAAKPFPEQEIFSRTPSCFNGNHADFTCAGDHCQICRRFAKHTGAKTSAAVRKRFLPESGTASAGLKLKENAETGIICGTGNMLSSGERVL